MNGRLSARVDDILWTAWDPIGIMQLDGPVMNIAPTSAGSSRASYAAIGRTTSGRIFCTSSVNEWACLATPRARRASRPC